jgi:hypothetical protein
MKTIHLTFRGTRYELTATCSAGMGFLSNLIMRGWYTEAAALKVARQHPDYCLIRRVG